MVSLKSFFLYSRAKALLECNTHLNTEQLSNSVSNVKEKKYKAGFKRLISDKVLKPFGRGLLGFSFYEDYAAAVKLQRSGKNYATAVYHEGSGQDLQWKFNLCSECRKIETRSPAERKNYAAAVNHEWSEQDLQRSETLRTKVRILFQLKFPLKRNFG